MTEMTKKEIWKDLRKQIKVARSERDTQQAAITKCEYEEAEIVLQGLKRARNKAFWNMFTRGK